VPRQTSQQPRKLPEMRVGIGNVPQLRDGEVLDADMIRYHQKYISIMRTAPLLSRFWRPSPRTLQGPVKEHMPSQTNPQRASKLWRSQNL
jgi:hypothetical protein